MSRPWTASLLDFAQDEALQIVRLRYAEKNRMIAALHPLFDDCDLRLRIDGGVIHDLRELRFADVIRAAAGDQRPSRLQQLQGAKVDLLVPGGRLADRRL